MRTTLRGLFLLTVAFFGLICSPLDAQAYIGPGVGITAIGTVIAFIGAIIFALVGFVWYPIKRLIAMFRNKNTSRPEAHKASSS